ncbi:MAG: cysteine synthase family protein [Chloroflexi bacterium]|nr:cysteine synthase family protein [Chloroflexota bacterium]
MPVAGSILECIGWTPLVNLERLVSSLPGRLLAKAEFTNPGASIKDRIALRIIETAERSGRLRPGGIVVELTSGNTGTGLAIVCAVKGYRFIAVMSEGNSVERRRMLAALGAEVELVPQSKGSRPGEVSGDDLRLVDERTTQIVQQLQAFRADQFHNIANIEAHEFGTGEEIWSQCEGQVDAFASTVGTGGTFVGIARCFKRHRSTIKTFAVEPAGAPVLAGKPVIKLQHKIQGAGYGIHLPLWQPELVDGYLTITDDDAIATARELATREGIFCGFSSGANIAAALHVLKMMPGITVVTTLNDSGLKYLSTDLYA